MATIPDGGTLYGVRYQDSGEYGRLSWDSSGGAKGFSIRVDGVSINDRMVSGKPREAVLSFRDSPVATIFYDSNGYRLLLHEPRSASELTVTIPQDVALSIIDTVNAEQKGW